MYKFNLLEKINESREKNKKRTHLVFVIFSASLFLSLCLVAMIYVNSIFLTQKLTEITEKRVFTEKIYAKLKKDSLFFNNKNITKASTVQLKRIQWTKLLASLNAITGKKSVIKDFDYQNNKLLLSFETKSSNKKSEMQIEVEAFKDSLASQAIVKSLLKPNTKIEIASQLELNPEYKSIKGEKLWYFSLNMEFNSIITGKQKGHSQSSRRKRFN